MNGFVSCQRGPSAEPPTHECEDASAVLEGPELFELANVIGFAYSGKVGDTRGASSRDANIDCEAEGVIRRQCDMAVDDVRNVRCTNVRGNNGNEIEGCAQRRVERERVEYGLMNHIKT